MKRPSIEPELRQALKHLKLGRILDTLADRLVIAEKQDLSREDFLLLVLTDEVTRRQSAAASRRAADAGLEADMLFERWDKSASVSFDKRLLSELTSLRFVGA
ncbi:MAG: hypothetical protein KC503_07760 [Myxococcales bacterium]|nr:hypothetical protein [Myxococcales bacterium]